MAYLACEVSPLLLAKSNEVRNLFRRRRDLRFIMEFLQTGMTIVGCIIGGCVSYYHWNHHWKARWFNMILLNSGIFAIFTTIGYIVLRRRTTPHAIATTTVTDSAKSPMIPLASQDLVQTAFGDGDGVHDFTPLSSSISRGPSQRTGAGAGSGAGKQIPVKTYSLYG